MRFPNIRLWAPFGNNAIEEPVDLEELGTAFGLDESLRGDAVEDAPAPPAEGEEPYAWLARRGVRPRD